ncbi:MAG: flavin reductase [Tissierellia bacterium]|nr:flavin reductase [Tissierellia bacterium]
MDKRSLFTLTYGLFLAGVEEDGKMNGCIINTAVQATSDPVQMNVTMMKDNLTTQLIKKKGSMTISVLSLDCPLDLIRSFGMQSGRECEKFDGIEYKLDKKGNPYLEKNTIAYMSLDVSSVLDIGSHYLFICKVVGAQKTGDGQPMTYADYRAIKSGKTINKANDEPSKDKVTYVCSVCHYVYDGEIPFEELPDDYLCPVCKKPKSVFIAET